MAINWTWFAKDLKRRREEKGMTQDALASKVGVRLATIARLEIADRRPSLDMLEKLARALGCRVVDLLKEDEMELAIETREPTLKGAPTYFRACVFEASNRSVLGHDPNTGESPRADYSHPGYHLGIHIEEYLEGEALEEFEAACEARGEELESKLLAFLQKEFPGCMQLIPYKRRSRFMEGFLQGLEREGLIREGFEVIQYEPFGLKVGKLKDLVWADVTPGQPDKKWFVEEEGGDGYMFEITLSHRQRNSTPEGAAPMDQKGFPTATEERDAIGLAIKRAVVSPEHKNMKPGRRYPISVTCYDLYNAAGVVC